MRSAKRPSAPLRFERVLWRRGLLSIAGVDEAGRGCLAGPVVSAAVVWGDNLPDGGIMDSKQIDSARRSVLLDHIQSHARDYAIGLCSPREIDTLNILNAALLAMSRALDDLKRAPEFCLVDGNRLPDKLRSPARAIVRGDHRSRTVAAASIVAKVTRDRMMRSLHEECPEYGWNRNMGYPTKQHLEALSRYGPSPYHRMSFRPCKQ